MASLRGRKAAAPIAAETEAATSSPATETDPNSSRAGQDPQAEHQREPQCQRRVSTSLSCSRSPSSNPRRLSAPHSTVATEEGNGYDLSTPPSSPDSSGSNRCGRSSTATSAASTSCVATSHEIRSRVRSRRHWSSSSAAAKDAGVGVDGSNKATRQKSVVVKVDAEILSIRGGVDFAVEAIGPLVRWTIKTNAGQQQEQQLHEQQKGSGGRREDQIEVDGRSANTAVCDSTDQNKIDKKKFLLFIPDSTDDPPLMRQIFTRDDGSYEETFDRPGSCMFLVGSGPMTMGRVVVSRGGEGAMASDNDIIDNESTAAGSCEARTQPGKGGRESCTVRTPVVRAYGRHLAKSMIQSQLHCFTILVHSVVHSVEVTNNLQL